MEDLPPLRDSGLLWEVIKPVLDKYNPDDTCLGTFCANILAQIFVQQGVSRDEFLKQMSSCYDAHYNMFKKEAKQDDR